MLMDHESFLCDETGAVTVDWVVLTAAIVGLGTLVISQIWMGSESLASTTGQSISAVEVGFATE